MLRTRRVLRIGQGAGVVVVLLAVLAAGWIGVRAYQVRTHLADVRTAVLAARQAAGAGDIDAAVADARAASQATGKLPDLSHDPVWGLLRHLPIAGSSLTGVQGLDAAAGVISRQVLPPLLSAVESLRGQGLRGPDGGIDLARVTAAGADLQQVTDVLRATRSEVSALPDHTLIGAVAGGRDQVLALLDKVDNQLAGARVAASVAPLMLGSQGPRHYFFALVNTAEARGGGGIIGAFAIATADDGKLTLDRVGTDDDLTPLPRPVGPIPADLEQRWGSFGVTADWRNADVSPHFPYTAAAVEALYHQGFHTTLDGVVALDPTAAGYIVSATSPLLLPGGGQLQGRDLTTYVEKTVYATYSDQSARKAALVDLQKQIFDRLLAAESNPTALLTALGRAAGEGRLFVASSRPAEEAQLTGTAIGGSMPDDAGPYAAVIVNNSSGDKLDYYLRRTVSWTAGACGGSTRSSTVTASFANTAPATGLPPYVTGAQTIDRTAPVGTLREYVSVYGAVGATVTGVTIDGLAATAVTGTERRHPVVNLYLSLPPGSRHTVKVDWTEPSAGVVHPLLTQAGVTPPVTSASVAACS